MPPLLEVTVESDKGEMTRTVTPDPTSGKFSINCSQKPVALIVPGGILE